jgi:hypothetical protein
MATKEQWVDLINLKLSGGDAPAQIQGKYSYQEIDMYLNMAFSDVLTKAWMDAPDMVSDYFRTVKSTVSMDTNRNERYLTIESQVLPLPQNRGILQVRYAKNPYLQFAMNNVNAAPIFEELEVSFVDKKVGYYAEGKRLYFDDKLPQVVDELLVKFITTFEDLGDEDEVIVPGGNNQAVFDAVYRLMLKDQQSVNQDNMVDKQV